MQLIESSDGVTVFSVLPHEIEFIESALGRTDQFDQAMVDGITPDRIAQIRAALSERTSMDHALLADLGKILYEAARDDESEEIATMVARFDDVMETVLTPADVARLDRHFP